MSVNTAVARADAARDAPTTDEFDAERAKDALCVALRTMFVAAARDVVAPRDAPAPDTTPERTTPPRAVVAALRTWVGATAARETVDVFVVLRRAALRAIAPDDVRPDVAAPVSWAPELPEPDDVLRETRAAVPSVRGDATWITLVAERGLGVVSASATPVTNTAIIAINNPPRFTPRIIKIYISLRLHFTIFRTPKSTTNLFDTAINRIFNPIAQTPNRRPGFCNAGAGIF